MPTYINPDNGRLVIKSNNDIDLNDINSTDSALHLMGGQYTEGNLYVSGTLVVNGDVVTLGNAGGSLTFNANISSDILPNTTAQFDIGSETLKWNKIFSKEVSIDNLILSPSPQEITSTIDLEQSVCHITDNTPNSITLNNGQEGQMLTLVVTSTPAQPVAITPNNANGYSNILLTNAGDTATIVYTSGSWNVISLFRSSVN